MNQLLPQKEVLIFDQSSNSSLLLAKSFLSNDYVVTLVIAENLIDANTFSLLQLWQDRLTIIDIESGCNNNYLSKISAKHFTKIILLKEFSNTNLLFSPDLQEYLVVDTLIKKMEVDLLQYAKAKNIPLYQPSHYHCTPEFINEIVEIIIIELLYKEKRTYINYLDLILEVESNSSYVDQLVHALESKNEYNEILATAANLVSLRDIFRAILEECGAELEFCGRGGNEKAVVVDFEESVLFQLGIDTRKIRLGNTLIKIDDRNYDLILSTLISISKRDLIAESSQKVLLEVKRLTNDIIYK